MSEVILVESDEGNHVSVWVDEETGVVKMSGKDEGVAVVVRRINIMGRASRRVSVTLQGGRSDELHSVQIGEPGFDRALRSELDTVGMVIGPMRQTA